MTRQVLAAVLLLLGCTTSVAQVRTPEVHEGSLQYALRQVLDAAYGDVVTWDGGSITVGAWSARDGAACREVVMRLVMPEHQGSEELYLCALERHGVMAILP